MAVTSNKKGLLIDGVEIPAYPSPGTKSENMVSKSWEDLNGTFHDIIITLKDKIIWKYDCISDEDLKILYGKMIREKIISSCSRFFEINDYLPGVGFTTGTYYLGATTTFEQLDAGNKDGSANYWKVELHWIEVDGIKLNSPLDITTIEVNGLTVEVGKDDLEALECQ